MKDGEGFIDLITNLEKYLVSEIPGIRSQCVEMLATILKEKPNLSFSAPNVSSFLDFFMSRAIVW